MTDTPRKPAVIVGEALEHIAHDLDEIRDLAKDPPALKAVLSALGEIKLGMAAIAKDCAELREDFAAHRKATNEEIGRIRRKVFGNGPSAAE